MLYFSDTVWVLTRPSSLSARDGALKSSKGDLKGPCLLSRLPAESLLELVLLDEVTDTGDCKGEGEGGSSPNRRGLDLDGGNKSSADPPGLRSWYSGGLEGCARIGLLLVNGRVGGESGGSFIMLRMLSTPELRRMCGVVLIGGELADEDMVRRTGG
jgi:hypothetical protein